MEPELDEDDPLTALSSINMPEDYRERSANLYADPKLRELKHYTRSHQHEQRLRASAGVRMRPKSVASSDDRAQVMTSLRFEGCGKMDRHLKHLSHERAMPPSAQSHSKLPYLDGSRPKQEHICAEDGTELNKKQEDAKSLQTRLYWRSHMDHAVKSLLVDLELARDARLKEYSHQARCDHLDKIYDWYLVHGMKEVRKERETPAHIRYNPDGPVMAGSMRVTPKGSTPSMSSSSSSPALLFTGSLGLDTGAGTPTSRAALASKTLFRPATTSSFMTEGAI